MKLCPESFSPFSFIEILAREFKGRRMNNRNNICYDDDTSHVAERLIGLWTNNNSRDGVVGLESRKCRRGGEWHRVGDIREVQV